MNDNFPKEWPDHMEYAPLPFSQDLHPSILEHLLLTGREEDLELIHPLIEECRVNSKLSIRLILDPKHPLSSHKTPQRGLFALGEIDKGEDLGTYSGVIRLLNPSWRVDGSEFDYAVVMNIERFLYVIDGKEHANEMVMMNDYRGIADAANVEAMTVTHRGVFYPMFVAKRKIDKGEELLWDYGKRYWESTTA